MRFILLLLIISLTLEVSAQFDIETDRLSIPMFYAAYAAQMPGGDMADRYGVNSNIGGGFLWKFENNWILGNDFNFLFGSSIKDEDNLLSNLKTESGYIIDMTGTFANVNLFERGYYITGRFGKLFPLLSPNPNSGFVITAGIGYLQHKIRIEVDQNTVPQLRGDYKKGYDRLAGGFMTNQFIGYMFLSNSRMLNFFGGLEFCQAWTKPRRDVNFDTRLPDPVSNRLDLLSGIKVGWIIPVFPREPEKFYLY